MIHIVFNEPEVALMHKVIELDETLAGDVKLIRDDFAVGPITNLDTEDGWKERIGWWRGLLAGSPYGAQHAGSFDDRETVKEITAALDANPDEQVWIWMAQNQHDVSGYYWLIPALKAYQGRIMILYMNNLPFINEKGQLFYPTWLHEIQPAEFLKAKKLCRPVTLSEFEIDPDEWKRLSAENAMVRQLEGGKKLAGHDESFYDQEILKNLTGEWQKSWRVLSNTLNRMKVKTGDVFIMWRMKELVAAGRIEVTGETDKGWKDFDVKLPVKQKQD
ncbi:MAG: DUF1835 domain-containing protein [Chitinophagaceae bacterium]|nr:MAG: DUF1835 domain-containing protein [Chitinophagaceae bacterium]